MLGRIELTCLETIFAVKLTLSDGYAVTVEDIGGTAGDFPNYFGDFYITGSGTGSFSRTYPYYQTNPEKHFDQLENDYDEQVEKKRQEQILQQV